MTNGIIEAARAELEAHVADASAALKAFPRGATGLTPDAVKFSPAYRKAKSAYDRAFQTLRKFNTTYPAK